MATHKQAIKRHRQSIKRQVRNNTVRSATRKQVKKQRAALTAQDVKLTQSLLQETISMIDKAVAKGTLPKKRASRQIARLSAAAHRLSSDGR